MAHSQWGCQDRHTREVRFNRGVGWCCIGTGGEQSLLGWGMVPLGISQVGKDKGDSMLRPGAQWMRGRKTGGEFGEKAGVQQISVQFSRSVVSDSLQPHGLQHARPPCPSPTPGVYSNSCNRYSYILNHLSEFRVHSYLDSKFLNTSELSFCFFFNIFQKQQNCFFRLFKVSQTMVMSRQLSRIE